MKDLKKNFIAFIPVFRISFVSVIAFTFYRMCFIFFNKESIPVNPKEPFYHYGRSLLYGLNYDLVITCYLIAPFLLFIFIKQMFRSHTSSGYGIFKWYFIITFTICFLICAADIPFYKQFGNHLNRGFFVWTESPGFVIQLIFSNISYWGYLFLFLLLSFFFYKSVKKIFNTIYISANEINRGYSALIFLFLGLFTFIGIRGRTAKKSPIKVGTAFFSEYSFFNHLGLNPCFVFIHSLAEQNREWKILSGDYNDAVLAQTISNVASTKRSRTINGIERTYPSDTVPLKYNVVVVLMESMSMTKLGYYGCDHLTNRFDSLIHKGLFFDHFYSAGIHTFNGLFSTETGFPAILDTHPLNTYTDKAFKGIAYWLKKNGYTNYFFTSHDPQFDNMEGFFMFNDFDKIYSQYDNESGHTNGPLGVFDHYLFESALQKMDEHSKGKKNPFFSYILTSSDHGPWEIPDDIPFKPNAKNKQDRATQYADWSIGHFIERAKKYDWFNNTLFVFVADHGGNLGHTYSMPLSYNHIPCLFYMPSKIKSDTISSVGGQIDVLPTLLSFLKIPFTNTSMGIDLMHEKRPYMYFTADSKIGCIDDKYYYINLLDDQKELLYEFKDLNTHNFLDEKKTKADSMKNYAVSMLKAADHIIKGKKY